MYPDLEKISLAPNTRVPSGFNEENWHDNGNTEMGGYNMNSAAHFFPLNSSSIDVGSPGTFDFGFDKPVDEAWSRQMRRAYFAATSFIDAQVGRVLDGLKTYGYEDNTVSTALGAWCGCWCNRFSLTRARFHHAHPTTDRHALE